MLGCLARGWQAALSSIPRQARVSLTRLRLLIAISVVAALAMTLAACGGGGDGGGAESPNTVLDQTFSSDNPSLDSGVLGVKFDLKSSGSQGGNLSIHVNGPFESQGANKIPKLDLDVNVSSSGFRFPGFNFDVGLISTGDAGFVKYNGSDYKVDQSLFDRIQRAFAQSGGQKNQGSGKQLLDALGIKDPKSLLKNLHNDGEVTVEGTPTTHISGDLDVDKTVDAIKNLLSNVGGLGSAVGLPSAAQLDQVKQAITGAHFDLYSGNEDHLLRRLMAALTIEPPDSGGGVDKVDLTLDLTLGQVNEPQKIEAPSNPKPFADLLSELGIPAGALGQLEGLGGLGGGSGGGGGGGGNLPAPAVPGGANAAQTQKYLNCVAQANSAADLQKCQGLAP